MNITIKLAITGVAFLVAISVVRADELIGKWKESDGGITEFLADGTWAWQAGPPKPGIIPLIQSFLGKWSKVGDGRLKIEVPPYGGGISEYSIANGVLTMKDLQGKVTRFTRFQPAAISPPNPPVPPPSTAKEPAWERPGTKEAASVDDANAELDQVYKHVMASLDPQQQNTLRDEERAWIKWRDEEVLRIVGAPAGGSGYRVDYLNAMRNLVQKRTIVLKNYRKESAGGR